MALFDTVLEETRGEFNLGDKANALLASLLDLIMDSKRGGFTGFLNGFNSVGLDDVAASWINSGANTPVSKEQVESALGEQTIKQMADRANLDYETAATATAFMLPHVVNELTPEGVAPTDDDLRLKTGAFLTGRTSAISSENTAEAFDRIGTAAVGTPDRREEIIVEDDSILRWLLPLLILALLVGLGFWFCGKSEPPPAAATTTEKPSANTNAANNNAAH